MSFKIPLVSIVVPTTPDRAKFNSRILRIMQGQDYINKEIIFDEEDGKIGVKRNRLAERAKGDIILHADSDDLYSKDWVSKSVAFLKDNNADVTGVDGIVFWNPEKEMGWRYNPSGFKWMSGATMCYWRNLWQSYPLPVRHIGEDTTWFENMPADVRVHLRHETNDFIATIHSGNTMGKDVGNGTHYTKLIDNEVAALREKWGYDLFPLP